MSVAPSLKLTNLGKNSFTVNSCLPYLRLTVKNFQFLRLSTKCLAVLRLLVNPIESLLLSMCNRNTFFQTVLRYSYPITSNSLYTVLFLNEARRQVVIEETWFPSTVFLCTEWKLENIYSGVNFCGNLFLRIAGKIAKISCNALFNFRCPGVEGV